MSLSASTSNTSLRLVLETDLQLLRKDSHVGQNLTIKCVGSCEMLSKLKHPNNNRRQEIPGLNIGYHSIHRSVCAQKSCRMGKRTQEVKLTKIASRQPHTAYCSLTQSLKNKWFYLLRTTHNIAPLLQPIEDIIRHELIPALCGKGHINDDKRKLFSLPPRLGSLGINILPYCADHLYSNSQTATDIEAIYCCNGET